MFAALWTKRGHHKIWEWDIRFSAEDRLSDCGRRFPGKNSRE